MQKDLIDRNTISKAAWKTIAADGSSISVVSLTDINNAPSIGLIPEGAFCVSITRHEMDMLIHSLDAMGDRKADREGYSAGEAYWDLKEKFENLNANDQTQKTFGQMVNDAQARSSIANMPPQQLGKEAEREM